jgi:hypothetical protein
MKNPGLGFILALLFGPLGMLYSSVVSAIIWFFIHVIVSVFTAGLGLIVTVPLGAVSAALACRSHNRKFAANMSAVIAQGVQKAVQNAE